MKASHIFGLAAIFCATAVYGATIAGWNFAHDISGGTNGMAADVTAAGITSASITRHGTLSDSSASYSFDSKGWDTLGTGDVQVGFSVASGGPWTVDDLIFSAFRSSTGPTVVDIYASVDGQAPTFIQSISPSTSSGSSATNYDISLGLTVNSSLNVSFVADGSGLATSGSGTLRLNNVSNDTDPSDYFQFAGTSAGAAVPTPAAFPAGVLGMMIVGAGIIFGRRQRLG